MISRRRWVRALVLFAVTLPALVAIFRGDGELSVEGVASAVAVAVLLAAAFSTIGGKESRR